MNRFAEHYKELASDVTSHSLNEDYWKNVLGSSQVSSNSWNINHPITMSEIESTVRDMKNNKAPGPDGIPTEFFKAFCPLSPILFNIFINDVLDKCRQYGVIVQGKNAVVVFSLIILC